MSDSDGDWDEADDVVIEFRQYDEALKVLVTQKKEDEVKERKEAVRKLAWLLQSSTFSTGLGSANSASNSPLLLSLNCLGYMDVPEKSEMVFTYELPEANRDQKMPEINTLYKAIFRNNMPPEIENSKPSLGNRFFIAHALAMTVLNIHSSRWVHKNICSEAICFLKRQT